MNWQKTLRVLTALSLCCVLATVSLMPAAARAGSSRDEAIAWVDTQVGKSIDMDGVHGAYSHDLIAAYCSHLGAPYLWSSNADFIRNTLPDGWQYLPDADPEPGDILVYEGGHVGIYASDSESYHQNLRGRRYVQKVTDNYKQLGMDFRGVIRPDFRKSPNVLTFAEPSIRLGRANIIFSLEATTSRPGSFSGSGFRIWDSAGHLIAAKDNTFSTRASILDMRYNVNNDTDIFLEPDTDYVCEVYAVFEGSIWVSQPINFRTNRADLLYTPFRDVFSDKYYSGPIQWAYLNNVASGITDVHFAPDRSCSRSMIVTLLWNSMGKPMPVSDTNPFVDVSPDSYYYKAVLWAVEKGIVSGIDETHFAPDIPCSRAQMVSFLWRANMRPLTLSPERSFTDVTPDSYYAEAVDWAVKNGITYGASDTHFDPDSYCTRGQAVSFLFRFR